MAGKGKSNGASPRAKVAPKNTGNVDTTATTTPAGNEQGQGDENATANVLSAGTTTEALPDSSKQSPEALIRTDIAVTLDSQPDDIRAFREFDCDDVASLFDIQPADVLSFREYDNRIVVVTTAGAKLEAAK